MSKLVCRISSFVRGLQDIIPFFRQYPPSSFGVLVVADHQSLSPVSPQQNNFSLKDFIGDGFLWAVPKSRRSIEKRLKRMYGSPQYTLKILQPKKHLQFCTNCGNHHEIGIICAYCYEKISKETELMKEKIQSELKLDPVDSEVVVLYDGEKTNEPDEFYKGKRIVEMEKQRPHWFSKNLMQKTTQQPATSKDVKPDELG